MTEYNVGDAVLYKSSTAVVRSMHRSDEYILLQYTCPGANDLGWSISKPTQEHNNVPAGGGYWYVRKWDTNMKKITTPEKFVVGGNVKCTNAYRSYITKDHVYVVSELKDKLLRLVADDDDDNFVWFNKHDFEPVVSGAESDKFDALLEKVKTHFLMLHAKHQRGVLDSHGIGCYGSYQSMLRWMGYEYKLIPPEPTEPVYAFVKVEEND